MDGIELELQKANTKAFIDAKPSVVVLTPRTRERTKSGGFSYVLGTPRAPQTVRVIELGMTSSAPVVQLTDGSQREQTFWLLGESDAVFAVDDVWSDDGRDWQITEVVRSNQYEQRAVVVERGR